MKNSQITVFIILSLSFLVPVPARFAYGLIMILELNFIVLAGILLKQLLSVFFEDEMLNAGIAVSLVFLAVLFRQIMILVFPVPVFTLGVSLYIPVFSSFVLGNMYSKKKSTLAERLGKTLAQSLLFSGFAAAFFAIREIAGMGALSVPSSSGVVEILDVPFLKNSVSGAFWVTIPGALILLFISLSLFTFILRQLEIVSTAQEEFENENA